MSSPIAAQVSVIVIGYNDDRHIRDAVRSALVQGPAVAEVIAVDDASTDRTGAVLDALAVQERRLRVLRRARNSGGCGSPRNDGLRAATAPYVMFLDSDDVLPPGAVQALLRAALRHGAPVVAGACVRRELPRGRESRWQRALFTREVVYDTAHQRPRLVRDTLCVNKLYARSFLNQHQIAFPEGAVHYEDFVFTARVLATGPRLAVIPDPVYIWQVRRFAAVPSISLARDSIANWRDRLTAHRTAVEIFESAGAPRLAHACRVKFLDHDLRLYVRELPERGTEYAREWWRLTREHLAAFDQAALRSAPSPARWLAQIVLGTPVVRELERMAQLAARPARLLPPYARVAGRPVWAADLPAAALDTLDSAPLHRLPVTVDGWIGPAGRRPRLWLRLRVHELYGRLAAAGVLSVDVELRDRDDGRVGQLRSAAPRGEPEAWTAEVLLDLDALARRGGPRARVQIWDLWAHVRCLDGRSVRTAVRPTGPRPPRTVVLSRHHGPLLVQPYATASGSLALRLAPGVPGLLAVVARRLGRRLGEAVRPGGG